MKGGELNETESLGQKRSKASQDGSQSKSQTIGQIKTSESEKKAMKIYIINFIGFQFDDSEEYHQNGHFIVRAESKTDAADKFLTFLHTKDPQLLVLIERNFDEANEIWGGPNKNMDITEISDDDEIITYDLGGYYG